LSHFEAEEFQTRLAKLARTPVLLVATDYDGTLAPIVSNPVDARPYREGIVALRNLAALANTQVSVISGRSLSDLAQLSGAPDNVHLVGSHGSEFDPGFSARMTDSERELHARLVTDLESIALNDTGLAVETKPASIAFHYRNAEELVASDAVRAILEGPAKAPGVQMRTGKKVIELSVVPTDKGHALESLRRRFGATAAIFIGDDVTDEDAFKTLSGPDMAIKVGTGESVAAFRLDGPKQVARMLARLAEEREAWLLGSEALPIEEHSMLSDLRTVALVAPDASIAWMCAPRIDSSALFSEILGGESAGSFKVGTPDGRPPLNQAYVRGTMVLESHWGDFHVIDYLDVSQGRPMQRASRCDLIRVLEGYGQVDVVFAPRIDFGRVPTQLVKHDGGIKIEGGIDGIVLRSPDVDWTIEQEGIHETARARIQLEGKPLVFELRFGTADLEEGVLSEAERRKRTTQYWTAWASRLSLPSVCEDLVRHSAIVLKGLSYGPSGAIAAAATASLPECIGGVRNWDYRFCWLRDGAMSAEALVRLGSVREAMRFLDWVLNVLDHLHDPERLRPLYTVVGSELGAEAEIGDLAGYAGSRPVRVGNGAANQVQLDVFGPIVQLVYVLCEAGAPLSQEHSGLVEKMVRAVSARWQEPDHGIWEIRNRPRHHVHSKVMCWMTVDRAVKIWERFRRQPPESWIALREKIKSEVLVRGWNDKIGAYGAAYGSDELDAASLWIGISGMIESDDPRFFSTVDAIQAGLLEGETVYRYLYGDGLPGREGGFHICTSWLVDSLIRIGNVERAGRLFEKLTSLTGSTGCLSEEYDPTTGRALGNHPQAYSHLGLIMNALQLEAQGWSERSSEATQ